MERQLGGLELQFLKQSQQGAGNMCGVITLEGAWPLARLSVACEELMIRYPRLGGVIEGDRFCRPPIPLSIPLTIIPREGVDHWRQLALAELKRSYEGALIYIHVLDGGEESEILLSLHHSLGDGLSVVALFHSLLTVLAGGHLPPLPARAALDSHIPARFLGWRGRLGTIFYVARTLWRAPRRLFRLAPLGEPATVHTELASCRLSQELTQRWTQALKNFDLNLFAGVCALVMLTLRADKREKMAFGINSPVNLRSSLKPAIAADDLGLYISGLLTFYQVLPDIDIYTLAHEVSAKIKQGIAAGEPFYLLRLLRPEEEQKHTPQRKAEGFAARLRPSFNISNNGRIPPFPPVGTARVVNYRGTVALWPQDTLMLCLATYDGRLGFEVHTSREKLGRGYASELALRLQEAFEQGPPEPS